MTTVTPMHCDLESNKNHPLVVLPAKSRSEQRQHVFGSGPLHVSGAVRFVRRPRTMPGDGNCGPTTTRGSQTMMRGCSEKYFLEGCYD